MFETNLVSNNSSPEDSILGSWDVHVGLEIEFIGLGFCTWKSSLMDSVSIHGNRVSRTRFSFMEIKPKALSFLCSTHAHEITKKENMWVEIKKIRRVVANKAVFFLSKSHSNIITLIYGLHQQFLFWSFWSKIHLGKTEHVIHVFSSLVISCAHAEWRKPSNFLERKSSQLDSIFMYRNSVH